MKKSFISIVLAIMASMFVVAVNAEHILVADLSGSKNDAKVVFSVYHANTPQAMFMKSSKGEDDSNNDTGANAGGGAQVSRPDLSPVYTEEGCMVIIPAGIDLDQCIDNTASDNSGLNAWICGGVTVDVLCPDD